MWLLRPGSPAALNWEGRHSPGHPLADGPPGDGGAAGFRYLSHHKLQETQSQAAGGEASGGNEAAGGGLLRGEGGAVGALIAAGGPYEASVGPTLCGVHAEPGWVGSTDSGNFVYLDRKFHFGALGGRWVEGGWRETGRS